VTGTNAEETLKKICPDCGKPSPDNNRRGSLTAFLFGASYCACSDERARGPVAQAVLPDSPDEDSTFCPICGLKIESSTTEGSLTGFLFFYTRCKCPENKLFKNGQMTAKLQSLRQANSGTLFNSIGSSEAGTGVLIDLAAGAIIGGSYKIVRLLGRGGMGEVYLARHETLGKYCALKVMPPQQVTRDGWLRFQLEAKVVAQLDHFNVVRVTDLGIHEGCLPFYAMDFVPGQNLAELLAEEGPLPLSAVLDIFMQVCDGVEHAHRNGIIHRDLKPANIMIVMTPDDRLVAKVLDFGLAKLTNHDRSKQSLTTVGDIFGSPYYMSPEQCSGAKLDRRTDIYSLGCTMFECLTGRPPFTGDIEARVIYSHLEADPPLLESIVGRGRFPNAIEIVIAKLLRKNAAERYQTISELRGDLEKVARGEAVEPLYVPRSKQWQLAAASTTTAPKRPAEPNNAALNFREYPRHALTGSAIASIAFLIVGVLTISGFLAVNHTPPRSGPMPQSDRASSGPVQTESKSYSGAKPPDSAADTAPFSTIVEVDGHKIRSFHFPKDIVIGYLCQVSDVPVPSKKATGEVSFPAEEQLCFYPYPIGIKYPSYLRRFRKGDIAKVSLAPIALYMEGEYGVTMGTDAYIKAASEIPGVTALDLSNNHDVSTASLRIIEKFASLRQLDLCIGDIPPVVLAKLSSLKQLEILKLVGRGDLTPVFKSLRQSPNLRCLYAPLCSPLSLDCLADISTVPNLDDLGFNRLKQSDPDSLAKALDLLGRNHKLERLAILKFPLGQKALTSLKSMKSLRLLEFDSGGSGVSTDMLQRLRQEIPGLKLVTKMADVTGSAAPVNADPLSLAMP